jgi:hypothetical protein
MVRALYGKRMKTWKMESLKARIISKMVIIRDWTVRTVHEETPGGSSPSLIRKRGRHNQDGVRVPGILGQLFDGHQAGSGRAHGMSRQALPSFGQDLRLIEQPGDEDHRQ